MRIRKLQIGIDVPGEASYENDGCRGGLVILLALSVLLFLCGCDEPITSSPASPREQASSPTPRPLRMLVVDDRPLAKAITDEWNPRADIQLKVAETTSDTCTEWLAQGQPLSADIVVYPAHLIGEFAQRERIIPVPQDVLGQEPTGWQDVLPLVRLRELTWGTQNYALSLGSSHFVLVYREDIFAQNHLTPPSTWDEYLKIAAQLASLGDMADGETPPRDGWHAIAEPWGPGWSGTTFLARAAAYAKHRNNYSTLFRYRTMEPLINGPPFVRALDELLEAAAYASPNTSKHTPRDVLELYEAGRCAMAICWPSAGTLAAKEMGGTEYFPTAFAELPGSKDVFHIQDNLWQQRKAADDLRVVTLGVAGRLVSVTSECPRRRAAFWLLSFLTGAELGSVIAPFSSATTVYRQSQLSNPSSWFPTSTPSSVARQYGTIVGIMQTRTSNLSALRIPGRARYMKALDNAVHRALAGELSAQQALDGVADAWQQITGSLGVESQSAAYRRSLGLDS